MPPELEEQLQTEVDAALEIVREDRDRKIQKEIDECDSCQEEGLA